MAYRPDWWPCNIDGSAVYLLDMCQILHEDHTGSSDPIGYVERDTYIRALEYARDNWKKPSSSYDDAVLRLVIRTLNERKPKIETPPRLYPRGRAEDQLTPTRKEQDMNDYFDNADDGISMFASFIFAIMVLPFWVLYKIVSLIKPKDD